MVCREWRMLVHALSNYHLWITQLVLDAFSVPLPDLAEHIAKFKYLLSESQFGDLDIGLVFPRSGVTTRN